MDLDPFSLMRCFIALDLSPEVRSYFQVLQKKLKVALPGKIRWVQPGNFHLTLKFFGDLSEERVLTLRKQLKEISFSSFSLSLSAMGVFPEFGKPTVLWVSVTPEKNVLDLQKKIDAETLLFSSLEQRFRAHLTLGRFVGTPGRSLKENLAKISLEKLSFSVASFALYQSKLSASGPKYTCLERYPSSQ